MNKQELCSNCYYDYETGVGGCTLDCSESIKQVFTEEKLDELFPWLKYVIRNTRLRK